MVANPETCRMNGAKSKGAITPRGKAIASRNATKHGLLAKKPPILESEDLETFQELVQNLVDNYQPEGAVEWHLVQTIAMCIQRQNRLWFAEAAVGNAQLLPPVAKPYTDEKYPYLRQPEKEERWAEYHPSNLLQERKLLTWFMERNGQEGFPTEYRSRYFGDIWEEWVKATTRDLERLDDEYPTDGILGKPDYTLAIVDKRDYADRYGRWLNDLRALNHPFAECWFYARSLKGKYIPKTKSSLKEYANRHRAMLGVCWKRLQQIEQIEQEIQQEHNRYQKDLAKHHALTASPIPSSISLLNRYESHISKQLETAIMQLQNLQKERKNKGSMGSFGQASDLHASPGEICSSINKFPCS